MIVEHTKDVTRLRDACFQPDATFGCGQCFRFDRTENGYEGVALGGYLRVERQEDDVLLFPCGKVAYEEKWERYFDLRRDYACLFGGADGALLEALRCARGLRVLNQPPFETLISFIISANNNEKRIRGIIRRLCRAFGRPFEWDGRTLYDFPSPGALALADPTLLAAAGAGYRTAYIREASRMVAEGFDLEALRGMEYGQARKELMRLPGVGPKVADCVLLFSMEKACAFPADVWIKRVLKERYGFCGNDRDTMAFAHKNFGELAGIAQQYLFYWIRGNDLA